MWTAVRRQQIYVHQKNMKNKRVRWLTNAPARTAVRSRWDGWGGWLEKEEKERLREAEVQVLWMERRKEVGFLKRVLRLIAQYVAIRCGPCPYCGFGRNKHKLHTKLRNSSAACVKFGQSRNTSRIKIVLHHVVRILQWLDQMDREPRRTALITLIFFLYIPRIRD